MQGTTDKTKATRYAGHVDFVRMHIANHSVEWIAERLKRSPEAIRCLCKRNKISFATRQPNSKLTKAKRWTADEEWTLQCYIVAKKTDEASITELSERFDRSESSVKSKIKAMRQKKRMIERESY